MISSIEILKKYWHYNSFRPLQEEIINAVLEDKDVITLLPTGGGKSICFQIPALAKNGVCLVISPLIALMQDQVKNLTDKGIKAVTIKSGTSQEELISFFDNIKFGGVKFLYISPERLQSYFIQQKIKELNINLIAIDEAHCISEWGHDFRPSYRNINLLKELHPTVNFIALTATANKKVLDDIATSLSLKSPVLFKKSFFRDNLAYQIFNVEDKLQRLLQIFKKTQKPAIVYVNSRNKTTQIASFLNTNNYNSSFYHAGLSTEEKNSSFSNWLTEKTPIMVATNAFGMGIDKANVGLVIHLDIPSSIENYLQEAGRAGRNNEKSFAVLLYNQSDILLYKDRLHQTEINVKEVKEIYKKICQSYRISFGEQPTESYLFNLLEFSKKNKIPSIKVDTAIKILVNNGIVEIENNYNKKATLQFTVSSRTVLNYLDKNNILKKFTNTLLRTYAGIFENEVNIDEFFIAKKTGLTTKIVIANLQRLQKDEIVIYNSINNEAQIRFLLPREDDYTINRFAKEIKQLVKQKKQKSDDMIHYLQTATICRSLQILNYFNENKKENCGICDVCISEKNKNTKNIANKILLLLKENHLSSSEICNQITANEKDILIHLQELLIENKIAINHLNRYQLNNKL
ncbi:ATP-dependent DNA helicase RecQ [uncultured Polaribacter sp.]|uniref:RecQ family ATP-dependent DNA helicase n=1 Tax=uncultured Polaribacter sp. TaxID=174711 RepID=UPI00260248E3|nr:ATP-dependent DNA helicase RecQ [uncultured Polaribacter sp.]